jgi:acetamidase/formamidase
MELLHYLSAEPGTVHWGYFDKDLKPALRVKSGDLVQIETVTQQAGDAPDYLMDERIWRIFNEIPIEDRTPGVHIMSGPIWIEDAMPGDMLEVRYLQLIPRIPYGSNISASWGYLYDVFQSERVTIFEVDTGAAQAQAIFGYELPKKYDYPGMITEPDSVTREPALEGFRIPIRPHIGTAGVTPNEIGRVSTVPPGAHGGNIDNWRIGAGATMYYPVAVEGAKFSLGDPHISQGDAELCGTAIECSLNVLIQVVVRKDFHFPSPLLETPNEWIVHGFDTDLNQAMRNASMDMLHFLTEIKGLSKFDAYSLMSVAADFSVTQVVDQRQGIHVRIPKNVFPLNKRGGEK